MKILVIKPSSFGDIIHAHPAVRALRRAYPESHISWLVFDSFAPLVSLFPFVDRVLIWKKKAGISEVIRLVQEIRHESYDLVVDLQGLMRTALIAVLSGAKRKIGVPGMKEFSGFLVKEPFPEMKGVHAIKRNLAAIHYLTGTTGDGDFDIALPESAIHQANNLLSDGSAETHLPLIGILPYVRGWSKQWPLASFHKLIEQIIEQGECRVVVCGASRLFLPPNHPRVIDVSGKTDIPVLAAVLKRCRCVIGGDTGPLHLAAALGVPVVGIYGGSDVVETAPYGAEVKVLYKAYPCAPCRSHPTCSDQRCLMAITLDDVLLATNKLLKGKI